MVVSVMSVACLQAWKIPRWPQYHKDLIWTYQEIYMMVGMFVLWVGLWELAIFW